MGKLQVPNNRQRPASRFGRSTTAAAPLGLQGVQFPGSTGGTVTSGVTYREVVACAGSARIRVRIKTATATGTLTVSPVGPMGLTAIDESVMAADGTIDPTKVLAYTTGTGTAAVAAATETKVDLDLYGENYVLVEFACTLTGTITWCDQSQV